jgi:hypothetical protein
VDDVSGVYLVSFRESGGPWGAWMVFNPIMEFNLTPDDGLKFVHFRVMDNAGNIGSTSMDSIILNTTQLPLDSDGDHYPDEIDMFPFNASEWADFDNDGIGDNADTDDDNDYYLDDWERCLMTGQKNSSSIPLDTDNDKLPDGDLTNSKPWMDEDDDNDSYSDHEELKAETDPKDKDDYPQETIATTESNPESDNYLHMILVFILILIIIVLLLIFLIKKKPVKHQKEVKSEDKNKMRYKLKRSEDIVEWEL